MCETPDCNIKRIYDNFLEADATTCRFTLYLWGDLTYPL